jgi:hypothetical protein
MRSRLASTLFLSGLLCILAQQAPSQSPAKRPITHDDYASWQSIQGQALSPDGSVVVYAVSPQEGDGEFVLRHVRSGKEFRYPRGNRPAIAQAPPTQTTTPPRGVGRGGAAPGASAHLFSPDGKLVLFPIYPSKGDKSKGKAAPLPTGSDLGIMEVATGKVSRIERVGSYRELRGWPIAKQPPPEQRMRAKVALQRAGPQRQGEGRLLRLQLRPCLPPALSWSFAT